VTAGRERVGQPPHQTGAPASETPVLGAMRRPSWDDYKLAATRSLHGAERGTCPRCAYGVRLRSNGYPQRHYIFSGKERFTCPGGEPCRIDEPPHPVATWLLQEEDALQEATKLSVGLASVLKLTGARGRQ
jgi:hypothetical protein